MINHTCDKVTEFYGSKTRYHQHESYQVHIHPHTHTHREREEKKLPEHANENIFQ